MDVFRIEKLDHFGRGIVKLDKKTVFVNNALIGDKVCIKIIKDKKNYSLANVDKVIEESKFRRAFCKYSSICGGCQICDLDYQKQLKYKKEKIEEIVSHYLKEKIKVNDIVFSKDNEYRNKITLHISDKTIGFYKKESNDIIEIDECMLVDNKVNDIIKKLKKLVKKEEHNLKEVIIRLTSLKQIMIIFNGEIDESVVLKYFDFIDSIVINGKVLKQEYIKERIGNYYYFIYPNAFFQVNRFNTEKLYNEVIKQINKKYNKILDLYCGTGTIGISLSKYAEKVIGIEENKDAVYSANENKKLNSIDNIEFICGKVEDNIDKLSDIDLIVVDPPRSGLDKKTISNILRIKPEKIIYVSCDPMTLVRDLNNLITTYSIDSITPVDMFPNTYHVESVCVLERKN